MDKRDKIIFWFATLLVFQTVPTWFDFGWYWFDLSVATIISALVLCLSFIAGEWFLENFLIYIYFIKLTNIISLYAAYGNSEYLPVLDASKPVLNVVLYIWYAIAFRRTVKGWKYE